MGCRWWAALAAVAAALRGAPGRPRGPRPAAATEAAAEAAAMEADMDAQLAAMPPEARLWLQAELERDVVRRGEFEAALMAPPPFAAVARALGLPGGRHAPLAPPPDGVAVALAADGVARVDSALSKGSALRLRDFCIAERQDAAAAVGAGEPLGRRFSERVLVRLNRCDLLLPLDGPGGDVVLSALRELLAHGTTLGDSLDSVVGAGAMLYECAALISDKGAPRQVAHPDVSWSEVPLTFTVFVALQDVDAKLGPTLFLPGTHVEAAHAAFYGGAEVKDSLLREAATRTATLRAGDASIFDSRTLHCGTRNDGGPRVLFYFTFRRGDAPRTDEYRSLRPQYRRAESLTLSDLRAPHDSL
ncbi:hypothetical protein M885DRAFT_518879 [Pelagophyceae sp. CCMP2097]|nr:hypothetical protein M885DRAFT_518879 [Pelagophyceae sp. CCMP2097]